MTTRILKYCAVAAALAGGACVHREIKPASLLAKDDRQAVIRRAKVWEPVDVASVDIRKGPADDHGFDFNQVVDCDYNEKDFGGASPKFGCAITPDDVVKVKYGRDNGEVFAEVAATRLLWALGFGADHMYPVRVVCRGCSDDPLEHPGWHNSTVVFNWAAIERKMPGKELETPGRTGWAWPELELVSAEDGGATVAERDALKLLAVMIQHTDSKPEQQRLTCEDSKPKKEDAADCEHPFMLLNDVGITFGRANKLDSRVPGSVDLEAWAKTPVFVPDQGACVGNIEKSFTGTLDHPRVSEAGREFLTGLLMQLSDQQLHDLFEVARFPDRMWAGQLSSGSVDAWVAAFKAKRTEIAARSCPA